MNKNDIPVFPRVVRIEPSSLCNLKCIHCPTGNVNMKRGLMNEKTFSNILASIKDNLEYIKVVVMYHGGEPLLNKNFFSMVSEINKLGIPFIKTVSNGMLLTDEISKQICESALNQIEFSLDGTSPEENDFIRKNSNFYKVAANIKKLLQLKEITKSEINIIISTTQFIKKDQNIDNAEDLIPEIPDYLKQEFADEIKENKISFKAFYAMKWPKLPTNTQLFEEIALVKENKNYCDQLFNMIIVRANGDIVPCCYDLTSAVVLGNINDNSLKDIWNNKLSKNFRENIYNYKFPPLCLNCVEVASSTLLSMKIR